MAIVKSRIFIKFGVFPYFRVRKGMVKTNHEKYEILLKSVLLMLIESLVECKSTKTHGPGLHVYASLQIRVLCSAVER